MKSSHLLRGIPASPGICIGNALPLAKTGVCVEKRSLKEEEVESEVSKLESVFAQAKKDISHIREDFASRVGEERVGFLDAQILALEDPFFVSETFKKVREERKGASQAVNEVLEEILESFEGVGDEYLKERAVDIRDVGGRMLRYLSPTRPERISLPDREVVIITEDLTPSDTAQLQRGRVMGFATDLGGRASHTAIMARALEIPAVVALRGVSPLVEEGDLIIVDGNRGVVVVNPDESTLRTYEKKRQEFQSFTRGLSTLKDLPAVTLDGYSIDLSANIELPGEVDSAVSHGAKGIGLYRTEFLYLTSSQLPSEEEQYQAYREVAEKISPDSVIIRTLDLGGDKVSSLGPPSRECNPFLGWRAIRFCLSNQEVFKVQLRAILRASANGNVKVLFPMISSIEELKEARGVLEEVKGGLSKAGIPFDHGIEVGVMIEIPSAALAAKVLSKQADFFSIGTNDLTQYTLAVDRANDKVAYLYDHLHPTVLSLLKGVVDSAHQNHIWVGVCGEMAGDLLAVPILLGMGVDEFSTPPILVPEVKKIVRTLTVKEAKEIFQKVSSFSTVGEIRDHMRRQIEERFPALAQMMLES